MKQEKQVYESPKIEVVEFEIEDSIALSGANSTSESNWIFD